MKKKVKCLILILTLHTRQVNTSAAFAAVFWSWPLAFFISACFLAFFCWDWIFWCPRAILAKPEVTHGGKMTSSFPILHQGLCGHQCLIRIYHKQVLLSLTGAQRLSNGMFTAMPAVSSLWRTLLQGQRKDLHTSWAQWSMEPTTASQHRSGKINTIRSDT